LRASISILAIQSAGQTARQLSPDLIKRLRKVEQKHRDQERRDELEFIENGQHYIGFDRDAAIEEFKRKWVR
jgi:hypothetical protein